MRLTPEQQEEIRRQRESCRPTSRVLSPGLEERLFEAVPVLDHGFVRVVDYMGDDAAVVQAARVSYGQGTRRARDDENLVRYLMRHRHSTPFEMCEIKFHVKLPVFVARQWIRHRTANVNEYSARYSILEDEFYLPRPEDVAAQSRRNAQGRDRLVPREQADDAIGRIREGARRAYSDYEALLNEREGEIVDADRAGIARELARVALPLGVYTQWYWKIDLHNFCTFWSCGADHMRSSKSEPIPKRSGYWWRPGYPWSGGRFATIAWRREPSPDRPFVRCVPCYGAKASNLPTPGWARRSGGNCARPSPRRRRKKIPEHRPGADRVRL